MTNCFQILSRKEKELLLNIVRAGSIPRTELQKKSSLKAANFYNTVDTLLEYNLITKAVGKSSSKGRPSEILSFNAGCCLTFNILITVDFYAFSLCTLDGTALDEERHSISGPVDYDAFFGKAKAYFERKESSASIDFVTLVSGLNPMFRERVFEHFYKHEIESDLRALCHLPVYSASIARAAALGIYNERYQESHPSLVFFNLSVGIGVGMVHSMIKEEFWIGRWIGIGHWQLDPSGRECYCGQRGCLVTSLGAANVVRNALELKRAGGATILEEGDDINSVIAAANNGDAVAVSVMDEAATAFVKALKIIYSIIPFDVASIGGLLTRDNQYFISCVRESMADLPILIDVEEHYIEKTSKGICYHLLLDQLS